MHHAKQIERSEEYAYIKAMFADGFDAEEVLDLCNEIEMERDVAQVYVQYHLTKHGWGDEFAITDDVTRFFNERQYEQWRKEREEF